MKTLKAICTAAILALAFSVPAAAGDISSPGFTSAGKIVASRATAPQPGDGHSPGIVSTAPGDIDTPASAIPGDMSTPGFVDLFWTLITMF